MLFAEQIGSLIRAGVAALWVITLEPLRALRELKAVAAERRLNLFRWRVTEGLERMGDNVVRGEIIPDTQDLLSVLDRVANTQQALPEDSLLVLENLQMFLGSNPNPYLVQKLLDVLPAARARGIYLVGLGPSAPLPEELQRHFRVLSLRLPDRDGLGLVLDGVIDSIGDEARKLPSRTRHALIEAALGLTSQEAEDAFSLAFVRCRAWNEAAVKTVASEKADLVKRSGILEVIEPGDGLSAVGGLEALKAWLVERERGFTEEARRFGLRPPRGILLVGPPGTGKSLVAKAIAAQWGLPLLRFDVGRLFGSLVGQSEANTRMAIELAETVAPCVLWIDEIEKGLAGTRSSGATDSGVTARVFGTLLTWMTEKSAPVFVAATANDVSALPPELLRKGRFDEVFALDLPTQRERIEILRVHLQKRGRKPSAFDLEAIAERTEGFSGAELEEAIVAAMWSAFRQDRDLTTDDILAAVAATKPLSATASEQIQAIRAWAEGRARRANAPAAIPAATERRRVRV